MKLAKIFVFFAASLLLGGFAFSADFSDFKNAPNFDQVIYETQTGDAFGALVDPEGDGLDVLVTAGFGGLIEDTAVDKYFVTSPTYRVTAVKLVRLLLDNRLDLVPRVA